MQIFKLTSSLLDDKSKLVGECIPLAAEQKLLEETNFHWRQVECTRKHFVEVIPYGTCEFVGSKESCKKLK